MTTGSPQVEFQATHFDPHELAREQLQHVYFGSNHALLTTLSSGLVAAALLAWYLDVRVAAAWFGWLLGAHFWHWMLGRRASKDEKNATPALSAINRHIVAAGLAGTGLGALAVFLPRLEVIPQAAVLIIMIIAVSAALPRLVVFLPIFLAYAAGVFTPLLLVIPFLDGHAWQLVAVALLVAGLNLAFVGQEVRHVINRILRKQMSFAQASWIDKLTGLANRRRFDDKLDSALRQASRMGVPVSLIMLDVDHFKKFNDNYGHAAGDDCLRKVAEALASCVKRAGDTVARYGGEEFAAVLFHTSMTDARNMGERLRQAVQAIGIQHELSLHGMVTVSIGGATVIPTANADPQALIRCADAALYRAKATGRNRVEWDRMANMAEA